MRVSGFVPWLLLGSVCTWIPHLESDPLVHESPGEECSSGNSSGSRGRDSSSGGDSRAEKRSMTASGKR